MTGRPRENILPQPLLTVTIPIYNGARNIRRNLESLAAQTFKDFRVEIVDNASTDGSYEIISEFVSRDQRFRCHRNQKNMGPGYSNRRMIYSVDTPYYARLHHDSYWAPSYAEECLNALESDPGAVLAYSYCQFVNSENQPLEISRDQYPYDHDDPAERYLGVVKHMGWCTAFHGVMRTSVMIEELPRLFERINAAGDNEFLALMALRGKLVQVEKPLFFRLKDTYQAKAENMEERYARIYKGWGAEGLLPFCSYIRDHCRDVTESGLPPEKADRMIKETISIFLARYHQYIEFELTRAVKMIIDGDIKRRWGDAERSEPTAVGGQQYRCLDFAYLLQINRELEYAFHFMPSLPDFHYARALVLVLLGRQDEAKVSLERELARSPYHRLALDLKARL
jgi:Glycosyltransferases involved in cell wall biogenesis